MSTTSTITSSSDWMQFDEAAAASTSFRLDATTVAATSGGGNTRTSDNSSDPAKQTRRRSRSSKKVPTTLLNAEPSNFRALVQQFTGCPIRPQSRRSGPITLNFAQWNEESIQSSNNNAPSASIMPNFGGNYYVNQPDQPFQQQHDQHQHRMFQDENVFSGPNTEIRDGFDFIDDVSVQDFPVEPYSSGSFTNDGYLM